MANKINSIDIRKIYRHFFILLIIGGIIFGFISFFMLVDNVLYKNSIYPYLILKLISIIFFIVPIVFCLVIIFKFILVPKKNMLIILISSILYILFVFDFFIIGYREAVSFYGLTFSILFYILELFINDKNN